MRRHLKCFFLEVLFKNLFLWSSVLFVCLHLSSPFLPVRKQKLSLGIRTQQGSSQCGLILIIYMMFVSRNPSELCSVPALSKNKSWFRLIIKRNQASSHFPKSKDLSVMLLSFICPSLLIRFGDRITVTVPLAFCCFLGLFPAWLGSPCVPRAAAQDLWGSELSSQLCSSALSLAPSLISEPRTSLTGCWIPGWDVPKHIPNEMSAAETRPWSDESSCPADPDGFG